MALLDLIQGVARRCNYPQPSAAFSSSDPNVQLMIDSAQDTGDEMVERWGWQNLKVSSPATFTGDGTTTLFALPAALETLQPDGVFVSSAYPTLSMIGPVNEDDLLRMKALPMSLYPSVWRVIGGKIEFYPALQAAEIVSYIYQGALWIQNSGGTPYSPAKWAADTDLSALPQRVVMLGAIWRWKRRKGLDYSEEMRDYEQALDRRAGQETTGRMIDMSRSDVSWDDMWPGTITDNTDRNY